MRAIKRGRAGLLYTPVGMILLVLFLRPLTVCAGPSLINLNAENIAVSGYDLVSYFDARVEPGDKGFTSHYQGATYLFSSAAHVALFESDPERFLPAYGGYCAYGVSMGKRLSIDPNSYEIVAGRLYLLLNRVTKKIWQLDQVGNIATADRLWRDALQAP